MLICITLTDGQMSACMPGFPERHPEKLHSVVGVSGPEVEANWITKELEQYGLFDRLISSKDKVAAATWLIDIGYTDAAAWCWVEKFYP